MTSEQAIAEMREKLTEFLRRRGLRKTPERYAIMERAMRLHMHFGVDDLYNAMEAEGYHASLATIYNTLELLCEASILNRHIFTTNQAKYELACGSHLHLICRKCGEIREIDDPSLTAGLLDTPYPGFTPEYSSSIVYGLCDNCRQREIDKP